MKDDLGVDVPIPRVVRRIVSLVPSLTESVASSAPSLLVGATAWCARPSDLDVVRVGGTKNPDVARILELGPDLLLANREENREVDVQALREAGVAVWVTDVRDVEGALLSLARMLRACGIDGSPAWLAEAGAVWREPAPAHRRSAVVPIWRRPWMAVGSGTFAGDVLARLGVDNLLATSPDRYPGTTPAELLARAPDVVVLPDEPYRFSRDDGPESFPGVPCALVDGRLLTWYGPSLVEARAALLASLSPQAYVCSSAG